MTKDELIEAMKDYPGDIVIAATGYGLYEDNYDYETKEVITLNKYMEGFSDNEVKERLEKHYPSGCLLIRID